MSQPLPRAFEDAVGAAADYRPGPIMTFADLFCGIGGFHLAASALGLKCAYACDIDERARKAYEANFGITPGNDIIQAKPSALPEFDLLCAGFPCQPFSIIGDRKGLADPRGALFREIIRLAREKRPAALVLENVRQLVSIKGGSVFDRILQDIAGLGYYTDHRILNALDYGLPQKRERVLIVATRKRFDAFPWPDRKTPMKPLSGVLEKNPDSRYFVSDKILESRRKAHSSPHKIGIWHENKGGNVSSHPYSCALRAGASYNYLLVNGERRLTPREMLRLQGFPDEYKITSNDSQIRKQAGNAVPVPLAYTAIQGVLQVYDQSTATKGQRNKA